MPYIRTESRGARAIALTAWLLSLAGLAGAQPFAYVTENTGGSIARINLSSGAIVRAAICSSPQGVAINRAGTRGYVACGGGAGVREFNADTLAPTNTFPTCGGDTYEVVVDPALPRVFATCGSIFGTLHALPLDGSPPNIVSLPMPGLPTSPKGLSISPDGSRLLVADSDNGVYGFDLTFGPLTPTQVRAGGAYDVKFDATGNAYQVAYAVSGVVETVTWVSTLAASASNLAGFGPAHIAASATGGMAVSTVNIGGVFHCGASCSGTYVTPSSFRGLAYSPDGARLLVARNSDGDVVGLNGFTDALVVTYAGFSGPWGIATGPVPVAVTINQAGAQPDPTAVASITFNVVFSEAVTGFDAADVLFTGSTVGGTLAANVTGSGTSYTVTVTGMTGDGTVVASVGAFAATSLATGVASFTSTSADNTVIFSTPPTVTIDQAGAQADPATSSPIDFTVTFSEPVTGFATGDVTIGGTALPTAATVTGGPTVYNVAVTGMTAIGTVTVSIAAGVAVDLGGNANTASTSTDNTVTYSPPPLTVTIDQAVGQADPALAAPINFTVTFSEAVTGFAASDVAFTGSTAAGALAAVVTGGPTTYTVAVSGMTSAGTVVASIPAGGANGAIGTNLASTSTDNIVTLAPSAPTVTIDQAGAQADPAAAGPINFTVTFSEAVVGFTTGDVTIGGTALPTTATVTGGPTTYNVAVTGMTSAGTVIASIAAGVASGVAFGQANGASTSADNSVTFTPAAPTVTINQAAGQAEPAYATPINFTVVFSAAVTGFAANDIQFTGSTATGALSAVVSGGPTTFNVAISGMDSTGTVVASVPTGAATFLGVGNIASTTTDNSVLFVLPVTSYTAPTATGTGTQSVSFTGGGPACTFAVRQFIGAPPGAPPIPSTAPSAVVFPHGLFDFTNTDCTQGATLNYTLTYPAPLPPGTLYWKYGPTASNTTPHWYTLPATIAGNTITFSITEGGLGDDDLTVNGTIVDQGGPGIPGAPGTANAVPTLSEWMLLLLAGLMLSTVIPRRAVT